MSSNRREFLVLAAAGAAALAVPSASAETSVFPKPASPADAFELLRQGNERYASGKLKSFSADLAALRKASEKTQVPFAAILSCADSRVPSEVIFDQSLGSLFIVRVAGNIATPDTIASLEYAAAVLGIKAILVVGHSSCGAVKAAMSTADVPGSISSLYPYIHPAAVGSGDDLSSVIRKNAELQATTLHDDSPVIAKLVKEAKVGVRAAVYDIATGKVTWS